MNRPSTNPPVVLSFAGHDPTGGSGLQADIETIVSLGCCASSAITALTVQDTTGLQLVHPMDPTLVMQQARVVLEDMPVSAVKIGLLASVEVVETIHSVLVDYPRIPVVLDPVLKTTDANMLADQGVVDAMRALLFPQATVLTPSTAAARRLAPEADSVDACAMALLERGADLVLVTSGQNPGPEASNHLYGNHRQLDRYPRPRLDSEVHGGECTLSAAIAALLAQGNEPRSAIHQAQEYTWNSLRHGRRLGMGHHLPNRLFWAPTRSES